MKKYLQILIFLLLLVFNFTFAQVGIGTLTPNDDAMLDISSTDKGLLLPRVALTSVISALPLSSHVQGMTVFNTATAGVAPNNVTPGYYYNNGTQWFRLLDAGSQSNIFNTNGTLTGSRTVAQSGNSLNFTSTATSGTSHFTVDGSTFNVDAVNNRIGINTNTPLLNLDITGSSFGLKNSNSDGSWDHLFLGHDSVFANLTAGGAEGGLRFRVGNSATGFYNDSTQNYVTAMTMLPSGNVGVGTISPSTQFHTTGGVRFQGLAGTGSRMIITDANGVLSTQTIPATGTNLYNADGTLTGSRTVSQSTNNLIFSGTGNLIKTGGNVGIGTNSPNAPLQFENEVRNRKIVLWDGNNNDHQFYGFGINSGILRYQINSTTDNHIFYTGTSTTTSSELMRIQGNGDVGIGTVPSTRFHTTGGVRFQGLAGTGSRMVITDANGVLSTQTIPSITDTSIYNTNGTLTGSRTVAQSTNNLNFTSTATSGTSHFTVDGSTFNVDAVNNRIGINTNTPLLNLDITGSSFGLKNSNNDGSWDHLFLGHDSVFANLTAGGAEGGLRFRVGNSAAGFYNDSTQNYVTAMTMLPSGNVGVGTISPSTQLHTTGGVRFQGLAGTGSRMVITDANGVLSTQTIPATGTNLYNADGTLTGSRTVSQSTNNLTFSGTGNLIKTGGNVGIGNASPNAPLHFATEQKNKKIVLWAGTANDEHQFYGFGTNDGVLRYQSQDNHIFYVSTSSTSSNELMRIQANGNVGIGTVPSTRFHTTGGVRFQGLAGTGSRMVITDANGVLSTQTIPSITDTSIYNTNGTLTGSRTVAQSTNNLTFSGTGNLIKTGGNVGIGTTSPNSPLQFSNDVQNRKIVLWEGANNDHQFNGFGMNNGFLRYQVNNTGDSHIFFAGTSASTSNEIMRIQGNGNVGIGTSSANAPLHFANDIRNRKIVLWEGANNDHQFYGFGINGGVLRYQTMDNHIFYNGTSATNSTELMRIQGNNGNVGINTNGSASSRLSVGGGIAAHGNNSITEQGAHIQWNNSGGEGETWIINHRGLSNNNYGIRFGATAGGAITEMARFNASGSLLIGTATESQKLTVNGHAAKSVGGTAWATFSDMRLKENVSFYKRGLNEILAINPIYYNYTENSGKSNKDSNVQIVGISAQELQKAIPDAITIVPKYTMQDGTVLNDVLELTQADAIWLAAINAIKELNQKIEKLEQQNATLQASNDLMLQTLKDMNELKAEMLSIKKDLQKIPVR